MFVHLFFHFFDEINKNLWSCLKCRKDKKSHIRVVQGSHEPGLFYSMVPSVVSLTAPTSIPQTPSLPPPHPPTLVLFALECVHKG